MVNTTSVWDCTLSPGIQTWGTIKLSCVDGKRGKAGGCFFCPFILVFVCDRRLEYLCEAVAGSGKQSALAWSCCVRTSCTQRWAEGVVVSSLTVGRVQAQAGFPLPDAWEKNRQILLLICYFLFPLLWWFIEWDWSLGTPCSCTSWCFQSSLAAFFAIAFSFVSFFWFWKPQPILISHPPHLMSCFSS